MKKNRLHSFINIAGLAISMAVSILILSYVWYELSFDKFNSKFDQIYRVVQNRRLIESETNWGRTGTGMYKALKEEFPEVLHSIRLDYLSFKAEISCNGKKFVEEPGGLVLTDPDIFSIFDIKLTLGDPKTAFADPNSIILTEEEAGKYFKNDNPIGRYIKIREVGEKEEFNLQITGIAKALPENSHFGFKYLIPYEGVYPNSNSFINAEGCCTYITLPDGYQPEHLEKKLPFIVNKYIAPEIENWTSSSFNDWLKNGGFWNLRLQPLSDIHLDNHYVTNIHPIIKKGNVFQVKTYTATALFLIFLACINFITLSTARSGARSKEVGMRKVIGGTQRQLMRQFLVESVVLSFIALLLSVIIVIIFYKPFTNLLDIRTPISLNGVMFIGFSFLIVAFIIGVIAGSYPAFILSAFRPITVLKGQQLEKMKGIIVRNGLVVFQFIISIILMISCVVVFKQYTYMQNKDLGFEKENIVIVKNLYNLWRQGGRSVSTEERELKNATFLQEILKHPNVINASRMRNMPGIWKFYNAIPLHWEGAAADTKLSVFITSTDNAYSDVFGLKLVDGKNFKKSTAIPQNREGVIINEKAAKRMGMEKPVGKFIFFEEWESIKNNEGNEEWVKKEAKVPIIGVFKDHHNNSLYKDIISVIYFPLYKGNYYASDIAVKFMPGNVPGNIDFLEKTWKKFVADKPLEYSFFDKEFEGLYNKEKKLAYIFAFFTGLAILIACLGMFGLAAYTAERRTKEIGIRKVMGASVGNILENLTTRYLKLLGFAILIACPVGFLVMNKWLHKFPFHSNIGANTFLYAGIITVLIVLSSVGYHSLKAALTNPARTLKYE